MIVDCISDLHGKYPDLPGGDLLILCGDYTSSNKILHWGKFFDWLKQQNYKEKIIVAGNHDGFLELGFPKNQQESDELKEIQSFLDKQDELEKEDFIYLCDSEVEVIFEKTKLRIWGTPWVPTFDHCNPHCRYFMDSEDYLNNRFALIPEGIDILVTHGPMKGILDQNIYGEDCGSWALREHIKRSKPRYHIFGHIHEEGNKEFIYHHEGQNTLCMNCSYLDENYSPKNSYMRLTIS